MSDSGRCAGECRHGELRESCLVCEMDRRGDRIMTLKAALREAILNRKRVIRTARNDDVRYEFSPVIQELTLLCDLDLTQHNPFFFKD